MKIKKAVSIFLAVTLIAGTAGGCASKEKGNAGQKDQQNPQLTSGQENAESLSNKENTAMGRYVEQNMQLPDLNEYDHETVLGFIVDSEGNQCLYTGIDHTWTTGVYSYYKYTYQSDGSWNKEDAAWLNETAGSKKAQTRRIQSGADGNIYAWFFDGEYKSHIIKTTDQISGEEVKIQAFADKNNVCSGFKVMESGDIIISLMSGEGKALLINKSDGSEMRSFQLGDTGSDDITALMDTAGNKVVIPNESRDGFSVYDTNTGDVIEEIKDELTGQLEGTIKVGNQDDYYLLTTQGLHHFTSGGSIMETIIDGSLNSMGIVGNFAKSFIIGQNDDYYVLFSDDAVGENPQYTLAHYVYDDNVPTVPSTQMMLYGLEENRTISRAIGEFQKQNPDIQIVYSTAQLDEGATTVTDSIRTLNAELLSGKGADLILLDGLPVQSYVDKGVLADISDVVEPMISSGELLDNIMNSSSKEGNKIYGIPSRFTIPIVYGDPDVIKSMQSLDSLTQFAKSNPDAKFIDTRFITVTFEQLQQLVLNIGYKDIMKDGVKLDKDKLIQYLSTVMELGKSLGATMEPEAIPPMTSDQMAEILAYNDTKKGCGFTLGYFETNSENKVTALEVTGLMDLMDPTTMKSDYQQTISDVGGLYAPYGMIGINQASKNLEAAKEFMKILLSESNQSKDLGDGFPVNAKALESWSNKTSQISAGISAGVGSNMVYFDYPNKAEIEEMIAMAKTLSVPLNIDRVLLEMIIDEAKPYFEGSISAEKAADSILSKANTYLAQ